MSDEEELVLLGLSDVSLALKEFMAVIWGNHEKG
jgi:hypothetical protein